MVRFGSGDGLFEFIWLDIRLLWFLAEQIHSFHSQEIYSFHTNIPSTPTSIRIIRFVSNDPLIQFENSDGIIRFT
jgi:hypothetical protein